MQTGLAAELRAVRDRVRQRLGAEDVKHIRRVERASRGFELTGRLLLQFGVDPLTFVLGTASLAVYKQLQNAEIGHVSLHGTYDRFPELPHLHRARFRWQAPLHEESWVRMHNSAHHPFTSQGGKDPDLHFGPVRLSAATPWQPHHRFNVSLLLFVHLFHMSLTTLYYAGLLDLFWRSAARSGDGPTLLERRARAAVGPALKKYARHALREYVLFGVLAGVNAPRVLLGNFLSSRLRDVFTSLSILVNHLGAAPSRPRPALPEDADAWFAMQVEASHDLRLPEWLSILTGALDCHIEHHLFPDLPPNRLREIRAEIAQICRAHGVEHRQLAWPAAVLEAWQQVRELSRPDSVVAASAG